MIDVVPDTAKRRRLGQVFTPRPIADWMARWVCEHRPRRILDPAVGQGVFVDAVEALIASAPRSSRRSGRKTPARQLMLGFAEDGDGSRPRIEVCDIDAEMLTRFASTPRALPVTCRREDFITACFKAGYDAVIANPPYVRHHSMNYGEDLLREFDRLCRRRLSRMTNLYGLFLIKIWTLLGPHGRAAVITPAEWLNADFGVPIKTYLLEENALDAIVHFDHAANVFDGALTTAAITLLRRDRRSGEPVRLLHVSDAAELPDADLENGISVSPAEINPRGKWTPLFSASRAGAADGPILGDIARCTRGIATGANDYFTLSESERRRWGIDLADVCVCVTKAQDVRGERFTAADVQRLIEADRRIYLLHPRPQLTAAVKRYLAEGERRGIHRRYLPSHRPVWYMPEHREPAPILVSVFARGTFRFVLNQAEALNLTPYHAIYLRAPNVRRVRALFDYLLSPEAQAALAGHRRIYGDGLLKVEPRDVEALPIPDELHHCCHATP